MNCPYLFKVEKRSFCKKIRQYVDLIDCKKCKQREEIDRMENEEILKIMKGQL